MRRKNNRSYYFWALMVIISGSIILLNSGCQKNKPPNMNPEHDDFYKYAHYFFTKNEREIFRNLTTPDARERFIKNFWEIRDPNPFTEENEFQIEIESRFEYASKYLKEGPVPGWKTDRGRIYIVLGPPSANREDILIKGGIIQWYYEQYNVYILFTDERGFGVYQMDLNSVSLGLLDVLDNNKYFIVNKEGKISWENFSFQFSYNRKNKEVLIEIPADKINYEEISDSSDFMEAKIKLDMVIYHSDNLNDFFKVSEIKTIKVKKEKALEKKALITVVVPLELPKGKLKIDTIVSDYLGDSVNRKFVKIDI